jgi:hypothetical protein
MPATDNFKSNSTGLSSPLTRAVAVTPNDSTDLTNVSRAIYVGGAGDLEVITSGGDTVTFVGVAAGSVLPIRVSRVKEANTSATDILALE